MWLRRVAMAVGLSLLWILIPTAVSAVPQNQALSPQERALLRFRLDRIFYEQDLLIRNYKIDLSDYRHQEKEMQALKVYERIPFKEDIAGLKESLHASAAYKGLKIVSFKSLKKPRKKPAPVPSSLYTDQTQNFRFAEDQLAERIPFETTVAGDRKKVDAWIASWLEDQMRLTQADGLSPAKKSGHWIVRAHAFRYKEVKFPTLEPRDPLEILPSWARHNTNQFTDTEPVLWNLVQRTQAITPKARPLYRLREQMQLNAQRLSFFISLAAPRR